MRIHCDWQRELPASTLGSRLSGINADLLIPGRGNPIKNAAVVVDDASIHWAGARADMPSCYETLAFVRVPGWSTPCHLRVPSFIREISINRTFIKS